MHNRGFSPGRRADGSDGAFDAVCAPQDKALQRQGCTRCRTNLKVALSGDGGSTWRVVAELEDAVAPTLRFHYPTMQQAGQMTPGPASARVLELAPSSLQD